MPRLPRRDPLSFPEHYTMKWTSRLAVCFTDAPANKIEGIFLHPLLQLAQQKITNTIAQRHSLQNGL